MDNKKEFFKIVASIFPTLDFRYKLIEKAYKDAKDAFRGKEREGGERYFEHLRAVALILIIHLRARDYKLIVAALLHDIFEDIPSWTLKRITQEYGEEIAALVEWLSKPSKDGISDGRREYIYHSRFAIAPREFFMIKMADRLHNLMTLDACPEEKRQRKIEETELCYLPYAEKHFILIHELEEVLRRLK